MGKVTDLTVTKGKTVKASDRDEWIKAEYSVKAVVDDLSDLEAAKAHLEGLIDGWLTGVSKPVAAAASTNIFPEDLKALVSFEETAQWTTIRPRQFLGSENFAKIADIVKKHGGDYVSQGKQSHFRIPRKAAK
jgi:hypothetical protein